MKYTVQDGAPEDMFGQPVKPGDPITLEPAQAAHFLAKGFLIEEGAVAFHTDEIDFPIVSDAPMIEPPKETIEPDAPDEDASMEMHAKLEEEHPEDYNPSEPPPVASKPKGRGRHGKRT